MFYGIIKTESGTGAGEKTSATRGRALSYELTEWAQVKWEIYTIGGKLVRTIQIVDKRFPAGSPDYYAISPGKHTFVWDGKNDSGETVATGLYFATPFVRQIVQPVEEEAGVSPVKRETTKRRGEEIIAEPDRTKTVTGEWQTGDTVKTPAGAAGFTPLEDLIRKGLSIDEATNLLGEDIPDKIKGIPRALLSPCATELVKAELISLNDAYNLCADNYLAMLRDAEKDKDKDKGFDLSELLKDPIVLGIGGLVLFLMLRK